MAVGTLSPAERRDVYQSMLDRLALPQQQSIQYSLGATLAVLALGVTAAIVGHLIGGAGLPKTVETIGGLATSTFSMVHFNQWIAKRTELNTSRQLRFLLAEHGDSEDVLNAAKVIIDKWLKP